MTEPELERSMVGSAAPAGPLDLADRRPLRQMDLRSLPCTVVEKGWKQGAVWPLVGGLMMVVPTILVYALLFARIRQMVSGPDATRVLLALIAPLLILPIGIVLVVKAVGLLFRVTTIAVGGERVRVTTETMLGHDDWNEPLRAYEGLLLKVEQRLVPSEQQACPTSVLQVHHDDPTKVVAVYETRDTSIAHDMWRQYCRLLGLPALVESDSGIEKANVEL